jgi:adenine-specific DNA methylase
MGYLADRTVDYVFTDPPFGGNINYSEMNFLWESWLQEHTDIRDEAIVNRVQGKGTLEYRQLLARAFKECRRVLKDESWMTVIFHNSSGAVWMALQESLSDAGFAVQGTQTFDKQHGTFKQFVSRNSVGYDLILHCRKSDHVAPSVGNRSQTREEITAFVRTRVMQHPERYRVHFLHVRRADEWDLRKLYAEWLAEVLLKDGAPVGFEDFQSHAMAAVGAAGSDSREPLLL